MLRHCAQQGSITLGIVFSLGMLGLGIAATTLVFSTGAITNNSNTVSGIRSLVTADAAAREGVYRLFNDHAAHGSAITFTAAAIPNLNHTDLSEVAVSGAWPLYEVRSQARSVKTTRQVVTDVDLFPSAFAFDQAVYTHGFLNISGNAAITGDVYASAGIHFTGNSAAVTGDAFTPGSVTPITQSNVDGDTIPGHPLIEPPMVDITPYRTQAITDGTYFATGEGNLAETLIKNNTTVNKIIYVADSVSISGGGGGPNATNLSGMLIIEGDLSLSQGTFSIGSTAPYDEPLIIYVMGDLTLSGNVQLNGIVYVEGATTFGAGTPQIDGALLSVNGANALTVNGNVAISYNPTYAAAWTDITGLDTTSGTAPQVKNWHEE